MDIGILEGLAEGSDKEPACQQPRGVRVLSSGMPYCVDIRAPVMCGIISPPPITIHLEPVSVASFGNRVLQMWST